MIQVQLFTLLSLTVFSCGQLIEEVSFVPASVTKVSPHAGYKYSHSSPSVIYQKRSSSSAPSAGHVNRVTHKQTHHALRDPLFESCFNRSESDSHDSTRSQESKEYSRTLIRGSHAFALSLTKFLVNFENKEQSNGILVSPFSIWSSLIVMYIGAKGRTEMEIKNALDISSIPKESVAMAYQGLRLWYRVKANANGSNNVRKHNSQQQHNSNKNLTADFSVATKVFINSNLKLSKCIQNNFLTEVQSIDFEDSTRTVQLINGWIRRMTQGKIDNVISADSLNSYTQMLIANAVYFKSPWENKFDASFSEIGPFYVSQDEVKNVTLMKQTSNFMFANSEELSVSIIDLPYVTSAYSMLIILPDSSRSIDNLVATMKAEDIYHLVTSMYSDEVEVTLPKFKLQQEFDLAGPLYSLGLKSLFDPRMADLSGFLDGDEYSSHSANSSSSPADMMAVNSVVHKATIALDEEGSEAAAATAFVLSRSGRPLFPTKFNANRPFMYLIRDTATNIILFSGIVRRPAFD